MRTRLGTSGTRRPPPWRSWPRVPAMATGRKHQPAHHAQSSSSSERMTTEQLNAQSLSAAQQGQNFTPSAPSSTPSGGGSSRM